MQEIRWIQPNDHRCSGLYVLRGERNIMAAVLDEPLTEAELHAADNAGFSWGYVPGDGRPALLWHDTRLQLSTVRGVFPNAYVDDVEPQRIVLNVSEIPSPQGHPSLRSRDETQPVATGTDDVAGVSNKSTAENGGLGPRVNRYQNRYVPVSQSTPGTAMVPAGMAASIRDALHRTHDRHGDLDTFVADRLGRSRDQLGMILSAEQVDAVSLAVDANEAGRAFILADQTGLGKGRILAALAAAAARRGQTVVFLTEKANLFSDFWRDIADIGADADFNRPFILNDKACVRDADSGRALFSSDKKNVVDRYTQSGSLPDGVNLVLATYSQFNRKGTRKSDWLKAIAPGAFLIADESHNAVGDSNTAQIISDVAHQTEGAVYSSATFAARPESMSAYAPAFPRNFMKAADLAETVKAGGGPLQEALAQTLAADGVLIRREHDLSGIEVEVKDDFSRQDRNQAYLDALAPILRTMAEMSLAIDDIVTAKNEANRQKVENIPKNKKKQRKQARETWNTANFGSRLAAIIRQFTSALKVDPVADECIASLQNGQKPVVVIESTIETLMREISGGDITERQDRDLLESAVGDTDGENRPPTFNDALRLMVDRMMTISVRYGTGDRESVPVDDPDLVQKADALRRRIDAFPDLSMSLIDDVRERIEEAGFTADEISARGIRVRNGVYENMPERDRNEVIAGFNDGKTDALVLTRAGATGLSLHASQRVHDQRPRRLIELQIPSNVIERIQFWGRVHRKGQTVTPSFCTMSTGLPFEMRQLAMQNRKAEALSANVTASSDSAAAMDVPDLIDETGNEVARRILTENPWLAETLNISMKVDDQKADRDLYFINKLMQRLVLLDAERQDKIYNAVVTAYEDALREREARTGARGRTRELDGTWVREASQVFDGGPNLPDSVFGRPVYLTTLQSKRDARPLRGTDIQQRIDASLDRMRRDAETDGRPLSACIRRIRDNERKLLERATSRRFPDVDAALKDRQDNPVKTARQRYNAMTQLLSEAQPGARLQIPDPEGDGDRFQGVVTNVRWPDPRQAHVPGRYMIQYAVPGDEGVREISLAAIIRTLNTPDALVIEGEWPGDRFDDFDIPQAGEVTVRRRVLEGNLFEAVRIGQRYGFGQTTSYTDDSAQPHKALLLPRSRGDVLARVPGRAEDPNLCFEILRHELGPLFTNDEKPHRGLYIERAGKKVKISTPIEEKMTQTFFTDDVRAMCNKLEKRKFQFVGIMKGRHVPQLVQYFHDRGFRFFHDGANRDEIDALRRRVIENDSSHKHGLPASSGPTLEQPDLMAAPTP